MKISKLKKRPNREDHRINDLRAPIVMVEYGDFECTHCATLAPIIESLSREFKNNLCFVYRHYPLNNLHPYATMTAIAAEAADQQLQFWPMHQKLFTYGDSLSFETIQIAAKQIKLDLVRFKADMESEDLLEKVHQDYQSATQNEIESTPTLYLNGQLFEGENTYFALKEAMIKILAQNNQHPSFPNVSQVKTTTAVQRNL